MSKIENLIQTLIKGLSDKPTCVNNFNDLSIKKP